MSTVSKSRLIEALKFHESRGGSILDIVDSAKKEKSTDELFADLLHSGIDRGKQDPRNLELLKGIAGVEEDDEEEEEEDPEE